MSIQSVRHGSKVRVAILDALLLIALRDAAWRLELQALAASSIDNRIREEANRQLSRSLIGRRALPGSPILAAA